MTIHYLNGDATVPQAKGLKIIPHVVNTLGGWGKGFVLAVSNRWAEPETSYRKWYREGADPTAGDFKLGNVQFITVSPHIWVANMLAQQGMKTGSKGPPIRYDALEACLSKVGEHARHVEASVHMPRIGTGLAGGKWEEVEPIIERTLCSRGLDVYVYDYRT